MPEETLKVHNLTICSGSNITKDNPRKNDLEGTVLQGTCGGSPFPSDDITIFPIGEKDVVYLYHSRGQRFQDMSDIPYSRILGYIKSARLVLTDSTSVEFKDVNQQSWQCGTGGHSGRIMCLRVEYSLIPNQDKKRVAEACPNKNLPSDYIF